MKTWIIEPRDPLIVRDGRPFGLIPGSRATSLKFPFPSTITGNLRTRAGTVNGYFDKSKIAELKQLAVEGPLLVKLNVEGEIDDWLLPAPADAIFFDQDKAEKQPLRIRQTVPIAIGRGMTNLSADLAAVGLLKEEKGKPCSEAPHFWYWNKFKQWLINAHDSDDIKLSEWGITGLTQDMRTHVSVEHKTQTSLDRALFQTRGLEFTHTNNQWDRLALAISTRAENITPGLIPLGGERRISIWRESKRALLEPQCPNEIRNKIKQAKGCRVLLITPAYFQQGFRPQWLLNVGAGVTPTLQAIAIQRPQVVSGWDFEQDRPKPTRRLAAAGTVLFLKLDGTESAIDEWINSIWMQCISDDDLSGNAAQSRLDGFGLAVVGAWGGELKNMEIG